MAAHQERRQVRFAELDLTIPPEVPVCSHILESPSSLNHTFPPLTASLGDHGTSPLFMKRSMSSDDLFDFWHKRSNRDSRLMPTVLPKGLSVIDKMMLEVSRFNHSTSDGVPEVEAMILELQHSTERSRRE